MRRVGCRIDCQRLPVVPGRCAGVSQLLMRDAAVQIGEGEVCIQLYGSRVVGDGQLVLLGVEVGITTVVGGEGVAGVQCDR